MYAFAHTGFTQSRLVLVPSLVPLVSVHLLVDQEGCKLEGCGIRSFVDDGLW